MTPNTQMEQISLAYIRAVAAIAGFQVTKPDLDFDSVDGILIADYGLRPRIEFQAKATTRDVIKQDHIHYPLSVKNYNDLRIEAINPRILIVLILPKESSTWIKQTSDELCIRRCAYWVSLKGLPTVQNVSNVTVQIPLANVLDSPQVAKMMESTEKRGELC